jgi:hypothetical protein
MSLRLVLRLDFVCAMSQPPEQTISANQLNVAPPLGATQNTIGWTQHPPLLLEND